MSYSHSSSRCLRKIKTATESHEYNISDNAYVKHAYKVILTLKRR